MIRREEFCDGHLVKEIDQVDVSTGKQLGLTADGRWRWYLNGDEVDEGTAQSLIAAWNGGQDFATQMTTLTADAGASAAEVGTLRAAVDQLRFTGLNPDDATRGAAQQRPTWEQISDILRAHLESRHILFVQPVRVDELRAAVDAQGWSHLVTVRPDPTMPPGKLLLLNQGAFDEAVRQAAARSIRKGHWR